MTSNGNAAALYLRLSKDRVDQTSTARQEADSRAHAEREGLEVGEVFSDLLSGFQRDVARPGFDAAVAWVTDGPGRTLIVWKLDRLSRRGIGQVGMVLDRLESVGSRVVFVRDGLDSSTTGHRMVIAILSEQARQESENMSVRTRSALQARRDAGKWSGGLPPYGFRLVAAAVPPGAKNPEAFHVDPSGLPGSLALDPDTAPVLRRAVDLFLDGQSTYKVALALTADEVPAPRGGSWRAGTIWQMLRSPVLAGWLPAAKGSTEPAIIPETGEPIVVGQPIISPDERRRIALEMERRSVTAPQGRGQRRGKRAGRALLSGLARCGECGAAMSARMTQNGYACSDAGAGASCPGCTASMSGLDAYVSSRALARLAALEPGDPVLDAVAARWLAQHDPAGVQAASEAEATVADLAARLADLEDARYLRDEFPGPDGAERYTRLRGALMERADAARAEVAARPSKRVDLGPLLDTVLSREAWAVASMEDRRAVIALIVDRVEVKKSTRRSSVFDTNRVQIYFVEVDA